MNLALAVLAVVTAVSAAVRSTWSPCGQSMLSSITPLGERARGGRFAVTASWFVVGAVAGGLTLGTGAAVLAVGVGAIDLPADAAVGAASALALIAVASDLRWLGFELPVHHRQVNERWLDRYRAWVYGAGFGWQIGVGFATYIMTAAVYLMVALAVLSGSPEAALAVGLVFGVVRGLAVLAGRAATSPAALAVLHRRFDDLAVWSKRMVIGTEVAAAVIAGAIAWGSTALLAVAIAGALAVGLVTVARHRSRPAAVSLSAERPDG